MKKINKNKIKNILYRNIKRSGRINGRINKIKIDIDKYIYLRLEQ